MLNVLTPYTDAFLFDFNIFWQTFELCQAIDMGKAHESGGGTINFKRQGPRSRSIRGGGKRSLCRNLIHSPLPGIIICIRDIWGGSTYTLFQKPTRTADSHISKKKVKYPNLIFDLSTVYSMAVIFFVWSTFIAMELTMLQYLFQCYYMVLYDTSLGIFFFENRSV